MSRYLQGAKAGPFSCCRLLLLLLVLPSVVIADSATRDHQTILADGEPHVFSRDMHGSIANRQVYDHELPIAKAALQAFHSEFGHLLVDDDGHQQPTLQGSKPFVPKNMTYFCAERVVEKYQCNCHVCECESCYKCECEVIHRQTDECPHDSCGDSGCWCSPFCKCCRKSDCAIGACHCKQCCDECKHMVCARPVIFGIGMIQPPTSLSAGGNAVSIFARGSFQQASGGVFCRFGKMTVEGRRIDAKEVRCMVPGMLEAVGGGANMPPWVPSRWHPRPPAPIELPPAPFREKVDFKLSLDGGVTWSKDKVTFGYYECPNGNCGGHGMCNADGSCTCDPGFMGDACENQCPGGSNNQCYRRGQCTGDGSCSCIPGYAGEDCQHACPGGAATPCHNNGTCMDDGVCACKAGLRGMSCSIEILPKEEVEFPHECPQGKWGDHCDQSCNSHDCSGHGICARANGKCYCNAGWYGEQNCAHECPKHPETGEVCSGRSVRRDGVCHPATGVCPCRPGYLGAACEVECPGMDFTTGITCNGHGTCNGIGKCRCHPGYIGDDCSISCPTSGVNDAPSCYGGGFCFIDPRTPLNSSCACRGAHYGADCKQMCVGACSGHGGCDSDGICQCDYGYWGANCESECPGGAEKPCGGVGGGICQRVSGKCVCPPDRWGDECENVCPGVGNKPCNNHGQCLSDGSCDCDEGYAGDNCGHHYCAHDCFDHGYCVTGGQCSCEEGWTGTFCDVPISYDMGNATSDPKKHGAIEFAQPEYYIMDTVAEEIKVRVLRNQGQVGHVMAEIHTLDADAKSGVDYAGIHGAVVDWIDFDNSPRDVVITIVSEPIVRRKVDGPRALQRSFRLVVGKVAGGAVRGEIAETRIILVAPSSKIPKRPSTHGNFTDDRIKPHHLEGEWDENREVVTIKLRALLNIGRLVAGTSRLEAFEAQFRDDLVAAITSVVGTGQEWKDLNKRILLHRADPVLGGLMLAFDVMPPVFDSSDDDNEKSWKVRRVSASTIAAEIFRLIAKPTSKLYAGNITSTIDITYMPQVKSWMLPPPKTALDYAAIVGAWFAASMYVGLMIWSIRLVLHAHDLTFIGAIYAVRQALCCIHMNKALKVQAVPTFDIDEHDDVLSDHDGTDGQQHAMVDVERRRVAQEKKLAVEEEQECDFAAGKAVKDDEFDLLYRSDDESD